MSVSGPDAGRVARCVAVLTALVVGSLWFTGTTTGAQDDPYGSTTTTSTTEPEGERVLTCSLKVKAGKVKAQATVTVTNAPPGATVRILIGGVEAGRATAPAAVQDGSTLQIPITVPELAPGKYSVTAVGDNFTLRCKVGDGNVFEVLAASSDDDGTDVLAFTGTNILILVALALLLLIVGRRLVRKSHRRRHLTR